LSFGRWVDRTIGRISGISEISKANVAEEPSCLELTGGLSADKSRDLDVGGTDFEVRNKIPDVLGQTDLLRALAAIQMRN